MGTSIHLVIKGGELEAAVAAEKAGVTLRNIKPLRDRAVVAECDDRFRGEVVDWYCRTENRELQDGVGYPDGTLLFHR